MEHFIEDDLMEHLIEDNLKESVVGELTVEKIIRKIQEPDPNGVKNVWRDVLNEFLNLNKSTEFYEEYDLSKKFDYRVKGDWVNNTFTLSEDLLNYNVTNEVRGFKYDSGIKLSHLIAIAKANDSKILKQRIADFIEEITGQVFIREDVDKITNDYLGQRYGSVPQSNNEDVHENKFKMIQLAIQAIADSDNKYAFRTYEDVEAVTSRFRDLLNDYVKLEFDQDEVNKILNGDEKPEYTLKQIHDILNNESPYNNA